MFSILVSILFASCVCFVRGQDSCQANSECKSIYECPQLLAIANKPSRTQEDTNFLLQAKCGYIGRIPAVCCPQDGCTTPVGTSGKCININKCSHIAAMLVEPVPQETIAYIRTLRCQGSEQFSICCVENPNVVVTPPPISGPCQSSVSAFPPDPKSGCCGVDSRVGDKIFGGTETGIDEYPWLVLIEYTRGTVVKTMCGGSLISGKYVLTAGHCVAGKILTLGTPTKVRLGEYDSSNEGRDCVPVVGGGTDCTDGVERFRIERTIPHPQYDPSDPMRRNDIALIRLEKMAPFTDFIRPICLPTTDFTASPPPNFTLFAAGWGAVSERQSSSKVKLHVDLPFLTQEQCQPSFTPFKVQLWKGQLCAGGVKGKDSCKGDSGGPLMHENGRVFEEIGIVSYGSLYCGTENFPAIYTKVFEYLDWIRSTIRA